ncbi:MAG TPA: CBS domain-containing protein [Casimicrobiaceae bacterium]
MKASRRMPAQLPMLYGSLRNVLDGHPVTTSPAIAITATVSAAIALMRKHDVDAVMAMDDGRCAGLFTAHDAALRVVGAKRDASAMRVGEALPGEAPSVDLNTPIGQALDFMTEHHCQYLVVTANGRLLGMLSRHDLTDWVIRSQQEQIDCAIRAVKRIGFASGRG